MDTYVSKISGHYLYLVLESNSDKFNKALQEGRLYDLKYLADIIIDTETRKVIKSRHF